MCNRTECGLLTRMDATATADFPTRYAAAWAALKLAKQQTAPMDAELIAQLKAFDAERFAACEVKVATIAATIPALQAEYDRLAELACGRCAGTGEYGGASRYCRKGVKYCFACGGSGQHRN